MLDVLVIGAGPYGLAAAKAARDQGLSTRIVGRHMAFWREHMPAGMFLRSGPDWHLDHAHELTFQRYLDEQQLSEDPIPLALFLAYTEWFTEQAGLEIEDEHVTALRHDGHFVADDARRRRSRPARSSPRPASRTSPTRRSGRPRASTPATSSTSTASAARAC